MKKPNAKELIPAMTAVAVMRSLPMPIGMNTIIERCLLDDIPIKQVLYATSVAQDGSSVSVQTQVPPLWVKIDACKIKVRTRNWEKRYQH